MTNAPLIDHDYAKRIAWRVARIARTDDPAFERADIESMAFVCLVDTEEGRTMFNMSLFAKDPDAYLVTSVQRKVQKELDEIAALRGAVEKTPKEPTRVKSPDDYHYTGSVVLKALPMLFDGEAVYDAGGGYPRGPRGPEGVEPDEKVAESYDVHSSMDAICVVVDLAQGLTKISGTDYAVLQDYATKPESELRSIHGPKWKDHLKRACQALAAAS